MLKAIILSTFLASSAFSGGICDEINHLAKNKDETIALKNKISEIAIPWMAKKHCSMIKKHNTEADWVLIDARNKSSRKATGSFKGTVAIESNHHDMSKHKFNEKYLIKKLGKYFGKKDISLNDLKEKKIILFCNGVKCFRSTWAACTLKEMGFSKTKVHIVLDGYSGLKSDCL